MSTCGSSSVSPCCHSAKLVVDEFCENINVPAPGLNIWEDTNPQEGVFTISVNPDSDAGLSVTFFNSAGLVDFYTLFPGHSRTDVISNVTLVGISSTVGGLIGTGKACITIYRKIR